jgi:transcriptional regulator with XRE-family HTH domain
VARKRRFSEEPFGATIQALMAQNGTTYRGLAERTGLSAGYLNHLVHGNRPVPSDEVIASLAKALGVEPEHFREYRIRVITERLDSMPDLVDRLYRRLGTSLIFPHFADTFEATFERGREPRIEFCKLAVRRPRAGSRGVPAGPPRYEISTESTGTVEQFWTDPSRSLGVTPPSGRRSRFPRVSSFSQITSRTARASSQSSAAVQI